ncbi:MAG: hypothetical protein H6917_17115 [Novosphingobium sp.]|nr:hypothetical protein [Novosphingobium sp.]MCP5404094.1 hypothetical protein [Novosphingobium sp.]
MTGVPPLDAEMARLLDRLEPPPLRVDFADRVIAAAAAEPVPELPRLRRSGWRRRVVLGVAIGGLLGAAAAAAVVPADMLRKLPVIGAVVDWVSPAERPASRRLAPIAPVPTHSPEPVVELPPEKGAVPVAPLPAMPVGKAMPAEAAAGPPSPLQPTARSERLLPIERAPARDIPRALPERTVSDPATSDTATLRDVTETGETAAVRPPSGDAEVTRAVAEPDVRAEVTPDRQQPDGSETRRQIRETVPLRPARREPAPRPPRSDTPRRVPMRGQ